MTNNERLYWKNRDPEKYKALQEWDSIRLPILQKLKELNKDIKFTVKKGVKCDQQ